jgi:hypothetical protein
LRCVLVVAVVVAHLGTKHSAHPERLLRVAVAVLFHLRQSRMEMPLQVTPLLLAAAVQEW